MNAKDIEALAKTITDGPECAVELAGREEMIERLYKDGTFKPLMKVMRRILREENEKLQEEVDRKVADIIRGRKVGCNFNLEFQAINRKMNFCYALAFLALCFSFFNYLRHFLP